MRNRIQPTKILLATLCASGLVATTAHAVEFKLASHERGKIESVDTAGNTLTVKDAHSNDTHAFTWNDKTSFQKREHLLGKSQTVTASELKPGEQVNVEYYKEGDHLVAKKVSINHESKDAGTTRLNPS